MRVCFLPVILFVAANLSALDLKIDGKTYEDVKLQKRSKSIKIKLVHSKGFRFIRVEDIPKITFTSKSGTVYKDAKITTIGPKGIDISYSGGIKYLKFSSLDDASKAIFSSGKKKVKKDEADSESVESDKKGSLKGIPAFAIKELKDLHCRIILISKKWRWNTKLEANPKINAAQHNKKEEQLLFTAMKPPVKGIELNDQAVKGIEAGYLSSGTLDKVSATFSTFKGVKSYQMLVKNKTIPGSYVGNVVFIKNGIIYNLQFLYKVDDSMGDKKHTYWLKLMEKAFEFL